MKNTPADNKNCFLCNRKIYKNSGKMDKKTPPEYGSVIKVLLNKLMITALITMKTYFFSYIPLMKKYSMLGIIAIK